MAPNKYDLQASYDNGRKSVEFAYALQPYSSVADKDITITNEELTAAYNKDKERYKQDAHRTIKYISVEIVPSEADYKTTEEKSMHCVKLSLRPKTWADSLLSTPMFLTAKLMWP